MEDLRLAAEAYYNNYPKYLQESAWSFFCAVDTDRDQAVSFAEVNAYFQRCGYMNGVDHRLFVELDQDRDGRLDFWEFLTLNYIVRTRDLWCKNCSSCLRGLYFTCSDCFDSHGDMTTYDLCPKCYCARRFQHHHKQFVDSYMLLRQMKQTLRRPVANPNQAIVPAASAATNAPAQMPAGAIVPAAAHAHIPARGPRLRYWTATVQAVEVALNIASLLTSCSVM